METIRIVEECYRRLPERMRQMPWAYTDHGRKVLESDDELNAYLAAYGEIHIVKCRAALQNFPYESLENYAYEIFDWGCGQGIATLTLLEMLEDRGLLGHLQRVTLIEPSDAALRRAEDWTRRFAGPGVSVKVVNRPIPDTEYGTMDEVDCQCQVSINLFSNILDIHTVNLKWLARKTASLAVMNYMVCIGPKFPSKVNTRLEDFCGYFNPDSYFSSISSYPYAYTQKTHHAFGCETRGFVHRRGTGLVESYEERSNKTFYVSDDYDYATECMRGILPDKLLNLYNRIRIACGGSYSIFLRPYVNSDTPDILMSSKTKGIVLVGICNDMAELDIQFERLKNIKNEMFSTHLRSMKEDSIRDGSVFNCVKIALYVPGVSMEELTGLFKSKGENSESQVGVNQKEIKKDQNEPGTDKAWLYVMPLTDEQSSIENLNKLFHRNFKAEYHQELMDVIVGNWHSYREGNSNFRLSKRQKQIVDNENTRLRVKGVAGSGKTQILANRAVKQQLRTGKRVLIITFNVALIQYIRMRINQVPADFPKNMFEVVNYHQFFKSKANRYCDGKHLTLLDWDNPKFFEEYKDQIERYETILIDEVQDFNNAWLYSIITYFLAPGGSISVFGDGEQNIYGRDMEPETKMPVVPTFSGAWGQISERMSMRIFNPEIARLSTSFARRFISGEMEPVAVQNNFLDTFHVKYWKREENQPAFLLAKSVDWIMSHFNLQARDVVVLAESIDLLRDVAYCYKAEFQREVMANFESKEIFDKLQCRWGCKSFVLLKNLTETRRVLKTHFTTDCDVVKMSTIHSFKGWESKSVILLLQKESGDGQVHKDDGYAILEREYARSHLYCLDACLEQSLHNQSRQREVR